MLIKFTLSNFSRNDNCRLYMLLVDYFSLSTLFCFVSKYYDLPTNSHKDTDFSIMYSSTNLINCITCNGCKKKLNLIQKNQSSCV